MAISYRLMQYKNESSAHNNQYFAKAVMTDEVDLNDIAERIQTNCSMKKSDCLAVLTELVEVMKDELQASHTVKLDGLGRFKIGIKGSFAETVADFDANKNINGYRVNFLPTYTTVKNGTYTDSKGVVHTKMAKITALTEGVTVKEY